MSGSAILSARGVVKRFGGFTALNGIDFDLNDRERVGLIGPNGSGKSTFVNCLTGALRQEEGNVVFAGTDITKMPAWRRAGSGLARSFQIPRPFRGLTVRQNIGVPLSFISKLSNQDEINAKADHVLGQIGLLDKANLSPKNLSQVDLRKLELGRALAAQPKVLIADEAMAGLSDSEVDEILDLLMHLNDSGIGIILIEHIMRAVMRFSQRVVVFVAGTKIADGDPREVMDHPEVVRAYLGQ
ncbi:MAG: ABC transporter ATP-binding protein [Afipia sp.]|jgi:branched-chain amino acid transport system ATP-binding protein|nr:ABC transporter ATP-binding protein [Afipia sp.]